MTDIAVTLQRIIADQSGLDPSEVLTGRSFAELGIHSLAIMQILSEVEATFDIELSGDDLGQVFTGEIGDLERSITRSLRQ